MKKKVASLLENAVYLLNSKIHKYLFVSGHCFLFTRGGKEIIFRSQIKPSALRSTSTKALIFATLLTGAKVLIFWLFALSLYFCYFSPLCITLHASTHVDLSNPPTISTHLCRVSLFVSSFKSVKIMQCQNFEILMIARKTGTLDD